MSEKGMQKVWKMMPNGILMEAKIAWKFGNPPTLSERSSVWESLCERLYVYLYVFYGKITLLRKADLYQVPPKPSPV